MKDIFTALQELGLSDYEARIYGALLAASPASATYIAKKCGLSRSSVYTTLSALIAKGLVGTTYKNDIKQFVAQDHSSLEQMIRREKDLVEKRSALVESMKASLSLFASESAQVPQIIFFEGQDGLKHVYLSMMRTAPKGSTLYLLRDEFVWRPEWRFIFAHEWHARMKRWKAEKDIHTKLLVNPSRLEKEHSSLYRSREALEFRHLPAKDAVDRFALYILADTIAILSMEQNNLVGVKIVNAHLAANFVSMFDALWSSSRR